MFTCFLVFQDVISAFQQMATFDKTIGRNSSDTPVDIPIAFTGCFDDYNVISCVRFVSFLT